MASKKKPTVREQRSLRIQQVIFALFGLIVILSMLISLIK